MSIQPFRIVAVDPLPPRMLDLFQQQLPAGDYRFLSPPAESPRDLEAFLEGAGALVTRTRTVTRQMIASAGSSLRLIQVMGRLPDRVDLDAARESGIPVAVMPHGGAIAVAEHAMALMLALARMIVPGHLGVANGSYQRYGLEPAPTSEWSFAFNWLRFPSVSELRGKTLGLVGLGEIGREVARRARAFDMTVVYHDRRQLAGHYEQLLGVRMLPLDEIFQSGDFVSLHVPHTVETEHLVDARRLSLMKSTAFLVNTARGGLVDEAALAASLRSGAIAGAGLDVFHLEPLPAEHPLTTAGNVVLTPHIAGGSGGGQRRHIREILENIDAAARGGRPKNLVE